MTPQTSGDLDDRVLALRDSELTYPAIAEQLELSSATSAHACFLRALGRKSREDQTLLRQRELRRLEALAYQILHRSDLATTQIEERLKLIDHLRGLLFAGEAGV